MAKPGSNKPDKKCSEIASSRICLCQHNLGIDLESEHRSKANKVNLTRIGTVSYFIVLYSLALCSARITYGME